MRSEQYLEVALLLLVCIAAINDIATRRIPNRLLLAGLSGALLLHAFSATPASSLLGALGGLAVGFGAFLPIYLLRGMAAGDVKMMAVVGAFVGPQDAFTIAIVTWCVGGVMALLLVALRGRLRLALSNMGRMLFGLLLPAPGAAMTESAESAGSMPYGAAIAVGTIAVMVRHYG